jgi:hypothetical protein
MAENTETKYPVTAELLKGLTGHTFGDMECAMIKEAITADKVHQDINNQKNYFDELEIIVIEKFKEYERLKTKR